MLQQPSWNATPAVYVQAASAPAAEDDEWDEDDWSDDNASSVGDEQVGLDLTLALQAICTIRLYRYSLMSCNKDVECSGAFEFVCTCIDVECHYLQSQHRDKTFCG